jgi:signal transduction histidine kinase
LPVSSPFFWRWSLSCAPDARLVAAERFSELGKLAAQVPHEIRNSIGAMLLKAENALTGDTECKDRASTSILAQVERIDSMIVVCTSDKPRSAIISKRT